MLGVLPQTVGFPQSPEISPGALVVPPEHHLAIAITRFHPVNLFIHNLQNIVRIPHLHPLLYAGVARVQDVSMS